MVWVGECCLVLKLFHTSWYFLVTLAAETNVIEMKDRVRL